MSRQKRAVDIAVERVPALDCAQHAEAGYAARPERSHETAAKDSVLASNLIAEVLSSMHSEDTKSPQGRNPSRARLVASAPFRILFHCPRRSQNPLLPRTARCPTPSMTTLLTSRQTTDVKNFSELLMLTEG
jgi:hypothetical protein